MKILLTAGARPNFMKIAPLVHEFRKIPEMEWRLVHTGQHYDEGMSQVFFKDFDLPEPDYFLNAGSGSHAEQTAKVMTEFEKVCLNEKPDVAVVVGDVNSTLACSITAKKLKIPVAHVEAGLRSGDMSMPEEINRIVTDSISDYLFVTEKSGLDNLKREGKRKSDIFFVGNIMIDALHYGLKRLSRIKKQDFPRPYAVLTLHRPSNVENPARIRDVLGGVGKISEDMKVYFPVHPRTRKKMEEFHIDIHAYGNFEVMSPMSYFNFLHLWKDAAFVLTDSGGLQEETTALGIPCFTIRENTERPLTVEQGTNRIAGTTGESILNAYRRFKSNRIITKPLPDLWDGRTAERIVKILLQDSGVLINI